MPGYHSIWICFICSCMSCKCQVASHCMSDRRSLYEILWSRKYIRDGFMMHAVTYWSCTGWYMQWFPENARVTITYLFTTPWHTFLIMFLIGVSQIWFSLSLLIKCVCLFTQENNEEHINQNYCEWCAVVQKMMF